MDIQGLYQKGYRKGRPCVGSIDGASIDAEICADSKCSKCGHDGMEYHPYIKNEPYSYRAFAVCPNCQDTFEF